MEVLGSEVTEKEGESVKAASEVDGEAVCDENGVRLSPTGDVADCSEEQPENARHLRPEHSQLSGSHDGEEKSAVSLENGKESPVDVQEETKDSSSSFRRQEGEAEGRGVDENGRAENGASAGVSIDAGLGSLLPEQRPLADASQLGEGEALIVDNAIVCSEDGGR